MKVINKIKKKLRPYFSYGEDPNDYDAMRRHPDSLPLIPNGSILLCLVGAICFAVVIYMFK